MKDPYAIIHARHVTEKAMMLEKLKSADKKNRSRSLTRCRTPKYVFVVDMHANKAEIASAVEEIFREQKVRVTKVNTMISKSKLKNRRGKGRPGGTAAFKKAVVSMEPGDSIDNV